MENRRMLKLAACSLACTALIGLSQTGVNAETKKGWYGVNNGKYNYYDENGQMVKNKRINIGGKDYSFDADGNWLEEIYSNSGKDYSEQYKKSDPSWKIRMITGITVFMKMTRERIIKKIMIRMHGTL